MRLSDIQYIDFNIKHLGIIAGLVSVICFSAGIFTGFFIKLIYLAIIATGISGAGYVLYMKHKEINAPVQPEKMPRPIIFNLVRDSAELDEQEILKLAGVDKLYNQAGLNADIGQPGQMQPVLPYLRNSLVLVLLGSQGTGKTTMLCHLIDDRADGKPIIIDPHGYTGKYGSHEIIGAGRDYMAIDTCMQGLMDELNLRYKDYYEKDYQKLYVYIDECTLLKKNCGSFQSFMEIMLTESRKVNIRLTLCLHSRRAKFLGLQGAMDLAEGIDWLNLKNENGLYYSELETEAGPVQLASPGAYVPKHQQQNNPWENSSQCHSSHSQNTASKGYDRPFSGHDTQDTHDTATLNYDPGKRQYAQFNRLIYDCQEHKQICEMHLRGGSLNSIAKAIWGASNGRRTGYIKQVLAEYNLL